jgi:hypothetical protein
MRLSWLKALGGFLAVVILSASAWGASSPRPGIVNYFEGQAEIGASALDSKSIGSAELQRGQSLTTRNGKAEILLTPGVFLRVGSNSSVKMISPDLANTQVRLASGHVMVEVDEIDKANNIRVLQDGASIRLLKKGLYDFDASHNQVRVFKGQALVREGERHVKVDGDHQLTLNATGKLKTKKFDKKNYEASLYRFSKLRSDYLAQANTNAAQVYVANGWSGPGWAGWYGPGWFWDSSLSCFTFFPPAGVFYSPFGYPFYSPAVVWAHPYFFGRRFGDLRGFDDHPGLAFHNGIAPRAGDRDFDRDDRPAVGPFHGPAAVAPRVGGFAKGPAEGTIHAGPAMPPARPAMAPAGPAMGALHAPGGFAFHGGGLRR